MDTITGPALPEGWTRKNTAIAQDGGIFDAEGDFVVSERDWALYGQAILAEVGA